MTREFRIYTDGATVGNPGPSGWGAVILGAGRRKEIGGFEEDSTNNRMEMTAVIEALQLVPGGANAVVHSDSAYVIDGITRYIHKWRQNDFRKADKQPVENRDLWEMLDGLSGPHVTYVKVPAHAGIRENERSNDIAQGFARKKNVRLNNIVASALPDLAPIAVPRSLKFPVYTVLEKGTLTFYRTWELCRLAVQNRRGVRYKKCKSSEELAYALEKWGLRAMT